MLTIPLRGLPGFGYATEERIRSIIGDYDSVTTLITCGDVQKISLEKLQLGCGKKIGQKVK